MPGASIPSSFVTKTVGRAVFSKSMATRTGHNWSVLTAAERTSAFKLLSFRFQVLSLPILQCGSTEGRGHCSAVILQGQFNCRALRDAWRIQNGFSKRFESHGRGNQGHTLSDPPHSARLRSVRTSGPQRAGFDIVCIQLRHHWCQLCLGQSNLANKTSRCQAVQRLRSFGTFKTLKRASPQVTAGFWMRSQR